MTLVSAMLYAVAIHLFMPYFMFLIIQMILMFVAFAKLKSKLGAKLPGDSVDSAY